MLKYVKCLPAAAILLAAFFSPPDSRADSRVDSMMSSFTRLLSPGELTRSHAQEEKLRDCYACHTMTAGVSDALCLDCHKAVRERLASKSGYHGSLDGICRSCHTDHKGFDKDIIGLDRESFNHRQSDYPLTGKHAEAKCEECHLKKDEEGIERTQYAGFEYDKCTDCHKDPHPDDFSPDCLQCHTTRGWKDRELQYSHGRNSRYKLLGKHQAVACDKCHRPVNDEDGAASEQFVLPNIHCLRCHGDEHKEQLSKQCENCHTELGWKGRDLRYSHSRDSRYKLVGKHQRTACEKCHKTAEPGGKLSRAQFQFSNKKCLQCHKDEHDDQLSRRCEECHSEFGWKGAFVSFNHQRQSKYKLDAAHNAVSCERCHAAGKYKPVKSGCIDCHAEYDEIIAGRFDERTTATGADPHQGRVRCDQCHDNRTERDDVVAYEHMCVECHTKLYGPLLLDWMKDWFAREYEIQALLRESEESGGLSREEVETFTRRIEKIEKIGSHNFRLAPVEWKNLLTDIEKTLPQNRSEDRQARKAASAHTSP